MFSRNSASPARWTGLRCDCASPVRAVIYELIDVERIRQKVLHGDRTIASRLLTLNAKVRVLVEEVGEVARAVDEVEKATYAEEQMDEKIDAALAHLREELVQVAACAVGWLETP